MQFDQAEYSGEKPAGAATCRLCGSPIADSYFELGGQLCCPACRERIEAYQTGGVPAWRFAKALGLGSLASAAGSVLYYLVTQASGYQLGLMAIVIGWMVGSAVRRGAEHRGGLAYQLMAALLTYASIAGFYVPILVTTFMDRSKGETAVEASGSRPAVTSSAAAPAPSTSPGGASGAGKASARNSASPRALRPSPSPVSAPVSSGETNRRPIDPGGTAHPEPVSPGSLLIALLGLGAFILAMPVIACTSSPILLLIYGYGIHDAWKLNQKPVFNFTGPYHLATRPPTVTDGVTPGPG